MFSKKIRKHQIMEYIFILILKAGLVYMLGFNLIKNYLDHLVNSRLSLERLKLIQRKRLRKILRHVIVNSPFYSEYYRSHGITLSNLDNTNIKDLPTVNRKILMDNFDKVVCNKDLNRHEIEQFLKTNQDNTELYKGKYYIILTSGTTGERGIVVYSQRDWEIARALIVASGTNMKFNHFRQINSLFIGITSNRLPGITISRSVPKLIFNYHEVSLNVLQNEDVLSSINKLKPDLIAGYTSGIEILAKIKLDNPNLLNINPYRISISGEVLTDSIRSTISDAFGVNPYDFYACSESVCLGGECKHHNGIHLNIDWNIFELVDENLNDVELEKEGRLLLTNLYNYTQPYIRYEMSDELTISTDTCKCGSSFPLLKRMSGRKEDNLEIVDSNGKHIYIHHFVFYNTFLNCKISKYQIIQVSDNKFRIDVVVSYSPTIVQMIREKIDNILREYNVLDLVVYDVKIVESISLDKVSGKHRHIIKLSK